MIDPKPVTLRGHGVLLEPLRRSHTGDLIAAATDGELWKLWFTAVPTPDQAENYIETALMGQANGTMLPWLVRDDSTGEAIGTTRYHDIVASIDRIEIGYTFYRLSRQRTHVNAACKLLLLSHAFEGLGCEVVGLRTDRFNHASQRTIERLGATKDGLIRHHAARRDGSVRDTVMYSILAAEWADVRRLLELRLPAPSDGGEARDRAVLPEPSRGL